MSSVIDKRYSSVKILIARDSDSHVSSCARRTVVQRALVEMQMREVRARRRVRAGQRLRLRLRRLA